MDEHLPDLRSIRDPRHPGITGAVCEAFTEAAEVCLSRHHTGPETIFEVECCGGGGARVLTWQGPSEAAQRAWNNDDDATRDGAYIVSVAAVEHEMGLVALRRAETRTGADYYLAPAKGDGFEDAFRLEVSGVDHGDASEVRRRLKKKERQAAEGDSPLPAFASVVGFLEKMILVSVVEEQ